MSEPIQNILLCSGGRTSGFMLRQHLDRISTYRKDFLTVFCNTGKEMPQTLDFVHEMESRWGVKIIWLEYHRVPAVAIPSGIFPTEKRNTNLEHAKLLGTSAHWFKIVNYETASRTGRPFDELLEWMNVLPNVRSRACSMQLKIRTAMRFLFSLGIKEYRSHIGIRKDESERTINILANCDPFEHPTFPLCDWGYTEQDVLRFWRDNDFDLHLESYQGNCDLCFLKAKHKRVRMISENPDSVTWWKGWEEKRALTCSEGNGKFFRLGEPYSLLETLAQQQIDQPELFCVQRPSKDIACSCAERGFEPNEEV